MTEFTQPEKIRVAPDGTHGSMPQESPEYGGTRAVDDPARPLAEAPLGTPTVVPKAAELVWAAVPEGESETGSVASLAVVEPTQVRRPWRSTVRSVFQFGIALATLLPFIAQGVYQDADAAPYVVGQVLLVAAAITRVMALPQVETFLRTFLPFLSAAPKE